MEEILDWVKNYADQPVLLFLVVLILSLAHMFVPPIPLESITVFGSYLAGSGHGNAFIIWLATTTGMTAGSILMYRLAKFEGERLLQLKWVNKYLPEKYVVKARIWFQKYEIWAIYLGKCITGMSFAVVFCCGLFKLEERRTFIALFLSNAVYYAILVFIGRYIGLKWEIISELGWKVFIWIGVGLILIVGIVLLYKTYNKMKLRKEETK